MFIFIVTIHIIASLFLIAVILLQAGRGGGLADTFGSSEVERVFGTKSTTILTRLTTTCAIIFIFTCLTLAVLSTHRSRSLIERVPEVGQTESQSQQPDTESVPKAE